MYCKPYCRLKAFRHRRGIRQRRADRELRSALEGVSSGRLTGASAKAKLGLCDLSKIRVDGALRKIINSL